MYQKFIINQDGVLKFGTVYLHKDLLLPGEQCRFGGGLWRIDHSRGAIVLYGRSFDFGLPHLDCVRRIDWTGIGGCPRPLLHMPHWPDEYPAVPVFAQRESTALWGSEKACRVLVTGGSGFLGSRLAWYLQEQCGCTLYTPTHQEMEITDIESCIQAVESFRPDFVIHCAAISSTGYCQEHPEASKAVNVEGTCHVVSAATLHNARCIYMSSDQVYQNDTNEWTMTYREEDTDLENHPPRGIYGRDKLLMEQQAQAIAPSAIALRLTWMYDSREFSSMPNAPQQLKEDRGIMANLEKARREQSPIKACTRERRGVTDVWEVVKCIASILHKAHLEKKNELPGGVYNCGAESTCTTYELYLRLAKERQIDPSLILPDDSWSRSLAMNTDKISALINSNDFVKPKDQGEVAHFG